MSVVTGGDVAGDSFSCCLCAWSSLVLAGKAFVEKATAREITNKTSIDKQIALSGDQKSANELHRMYRWTHMLVSGNIVTNKSIGM